LLHHANPALAHYSVSQSAAQKLEPEYGQLQEKIQSSKGVFADETMKRVGGG
jgi:hypothetical protein